MRTTRAISLAALAFLGGCGGCDSCIAKPEDMTLTEPPAPSVAPQVVPRVTADDNDGGIDIDAAVQKAIDAGVTVPFASALPRPKAPMPIGAYQACGVYDGPLCEKTCLKGACRQECDGVECKLSCGGGYCSQLCGANAKCTMTCEGGHCTQACTSPDGCTKECPGGSCT